MQFTIEPSDLIAGLRVVAHAIAPETVNPDWNAVQLYAKPKGLTLVVEAHVVSLYHTLTLPVETPGRLQVPYKIFLNLLQTFPAAPLTLASNYSTLTLRYDHPDLTIQTSIKGKRVGELRTLPPRKPAVTLKVTTLRQALPLITFAASPSQEYEALTGVSITANETHLTCTAADGYRLSRYSIKLAHPIETPFTTLIPANALDILYHLLQSSNVSSITLGVPTACGDIAFTIGDSILLTSSLEAQYPNVQQIIDTIPEAAKLTVPREIFLQACRRATLSEQNTLNLTWDDAGLTLIAPGDHEVRTQLNVPPGPGDVTTVLNARFLTDLLTALPTAEVTLMLNSYPHPAIFSATELPHFWHMIMPMKPNVQTTSEG